MATRSISRIRARQAGTDSSMESEMDGGVVLLDEDLQPIALDQGAASILAAASKPHRGGRAVLPAPLAMPADLADMMRRSEPTHSGSASFQFCAGDRLYTGRTFAVAAQSSASPRPAFLLYLERGVGFGDSFSRVGEEYHLTAREREALCGITIGLTSKELAERMNIRPSTVKAFLRVMMIKMGAYNRAGVVAKLLTSRNSLPEASAKR